jgi:hypothetical protein
LVIDGQSGGHGVTLIDLSSKSEEPHGKPVKKMRLIPAEKAFAFARKLQGTPGCTVSVC